MPLFIRNPVAQEVVEAEQVLAGAQAHVQGSRPARVGEWVIINHATGETSLMADDEFRANYSALPVPPQALRNEDLIRAQRASPTQDEEEDGFEIHSEDNGPQVPSEPTLEPGQSQTFTNAPQSPAQGETPPAPITFTSSGQQSSQPIVDNVRGADTASEPITPPGPAPVTAPPESQRSEPIGDA